MPLFLVTVAAGLMGSISMSLIKGVTDTYQNNGLSHFSIYIYATVAVCVGICQLITLNKSMELYEQVDTIPIYQSSLILLNIAAGAIIMQESRLYSLYEFLMIILGGFVAILGVWIIMKKPVSMKIREYDEFIPAQ